MNKVESFLTEHLLEQLTQAKGTACLDTISSIVRCHLQSDPGIAQQLHELVDDTDLRVAGFAAAALLEPAIHGKTTLGRLLQGHYPQHPYSTSRAYLGFLCWQVTQGHLSIMPDGKKGRMVKPDGEMTADQALKMILQRIIAVYFMPYYTVLSEKVAVGSLSPSQSNKSVKLLQEIGMFPNVESNIHWFAAWTAYFLSWLTNDNIAGSLVEQALGEYDLSQTIDMLGWRSSASGSGANVIDTLYSPPEEPAARRQFLVNLLEQGSQELEMYWWTVMSAIEKLGDPVYFGDQHVIEALLDKVRNFILAENAYETKSVGKFQVMYMPVWPHGQKGAYLGLLNALAVVGNEETVATLTSLMTASPFPDAVAECIFRITRRLQSNEDLQKGATQEGGQLTEAELEWGEGLDRKEEGNLDKAIIHLRHAVDLDPALTNAWYNLGFCYLEKGNQVEALHCLEEALKSEPEAVDIMANVASLYAALGDPDKALAVAEKAIGIDPGCDHAWYLRWSLYKSRAQEMEARECLKDAILECPTSPLLFGDLMNGGLIYDLSGNKAAKPKNRITQNKAIAFLARLLGRK